MMVRLSALVPLLAFAAAAQPQPIPTFELERFTVNAGSRETLITNTADQLTAKHLRVGLVGHYAHTPLLFTIDDQAAGAVVRSRVTAHLAAAYGIVDLVEVGVQVPIVAFQAGDDLTASGIAPVASFGLGAPVISGRLALLRQDTERPLDLGLSIALSLPFGSADALGKDPGIGLAFAPQFALARSFGPVRVGGNVGGVVRGVSVLSPTSTEIVDEIGSQLTFGAVVSTTRELSLVRGELGVRGQVPLTRSLASVEVLAGARISLVDDALELSLLGGPGLGRTAGTPAFRAMLGVTWTPSFDQRSPSTPKATGEDTDGDGVPDSVDRCVATPGISQRDGCPDTDSDGDGVMDSIDRCPKEQGLSDRQGCP